jgi:hypothetical protein
MMAVLTDGYWEDGDQLETIEKNSVFFTFSVISCELACSCAISLNSSSILSEHTL